MTPEESREHAAEMLYRRDVAVYPGLDDGRSWDELTDVERDIWRDAVSPKERI